MAHTFCDVSSDDVGLAYAIRLLLHVSGPRFVASCELYEETGAACFDATQLDALL